MSTFINVIIYNLLRYVAVLSVKLRFMNSNSSSLEHSENDVTIYPVLVESD